MAKETIYRYSLRTASNCWLGEVILTDNKEFFAMTDWGNFNYCWSTQEDIRAFILRLDENYFSSKMFQSVSYQCSTKKMEDCCKRFASKILPALKEAIRKELINTEG